MKKIPLFYFFVLLFMFGQQLAGQEIQKESSIKFGLVKGLDTLGLKTGDLLFFESMTFKSFLTKIGTLAPYTHSAMVLREEDDSLWLVHATDNDYDGEGLDVRNEEKPRSGIILTRLKDLFISTDGGGKGYYKRIWVYRLNESLVKRPDREALREMYNKLKYLEFEQSNLHFLLVAWDIRIFGKDLLSINNCDAIMCSELIVDLLQEFQYPIMFRQASHEVSPKGVVRKIKKICREPITYKFSDGLYSIN